MITPSQIELNSDVKRSLKSLVTSTITLNQSENDMWQLHLSYDKLQLSYDKWFCHMSFSDWFRALELVMRLLRLRLTSELSSIWLGVIMNMCRMRDCYVDLGMGLDRIA